MTPKRFFAPRSAPASKSKGFIATPRLPPIFSSPVLRRDIRWARRSVAISASSIDADKSEPQAGEQATLSFAADEKQDIGRAAVAIRAVAPVVESQLRAQGAWELAANLEFPLIQVLARMEHAGILVDRDYLEKLNADFGQRMTALEADDSAARRRRVQRQLQSAAAAHSLRQVGLAKDS